jgi:hypothetical protein
LEARLRALPPPPVPADLEARLLAAIPAAVPVPTRRRAAWAGAVGALAAACLLAVLAWPRRDGKDAIPSTSADAPAHQVAPRLPDDSASLAAWREARRGLGGAEPPSFTWPLEETSLITASPSIPRDLLD